MPLVWDWLPERTKRLFANPTNLDLVKELAKELVRTKTLDGDAVETLFQKRLVELSQQIAAAAFPNAAPPPPDA
ncbi:MAG: hypothetical protein ACKODH_10190 [Limisphaerales bacterium]